MALAKEFETSPTDAMNAFGDNLKRFFNTGLRWTEFLNDDIIQTENTLKNLSKSNLNRVLFLGFASINKDLHNNYFYDYEDFCLFKNFPHEKSVYPILQIQKYQN